MQGLRPARATKPSPPARWSTGVCDCCEDPRLACTVCLCAPNATGQLYARVTKRANRCVWISAAGWALFVTTQALSQASSALGQQVTDTVCWFGMCTTFVDWDRVATLSILASISGAVGCAATVFAAYFVCTSRRILRARDRIPGGDCGDCCVSYWCGCCATVQMLRHDRVTGADYRACSETGTDATLRV